MSWIIVTVTAYFLTAINSVIDKYLLNKSIPEPVTYAFYVGIFSIFTLVLTPFGFHWPGIWQFIASILTGTIFLLALIALYTALKADEASRVFAFVGGLSPVLIIIFSAILFDKILLQHEYYAFLFLVAGSILISFRKSKECGIFEFRKHQCVQSMEMALFASVFFALYFVFAKYIFENQDFISGFVWTRVGIFAAAILLLAIPENRRVIFDTSKKITSKTSGLFIFNKGMAGTATLAINYAIKSAPSSSAAIVNALEGVKYIFILVITYFISKKMPHIIEEQISIPALAQKISAIVFIFIGIFILIAYR